MAFDPKHKQTPPASEKDKKKEDIKTDEHVSVYPNPRANENLKDKNVNPKNDDQVGSEITDGEAG